MATDTTLASIEEQQNILAQKARDARQAYLNATTDAEKDRIQAERDSYRKQISDLSTQKEVISKQDPATSTYAGVDQNSGREKYYNPVTGQMYLSDTKPSDTQKQGFETTVQQSGAPVDPANSANSTPPAVAKANIPVDTLAPLTPATDSTIVQPVPTVTIPGQSSPNSVADTNVATQVVQPTAPILAAPPSQFYEEFIQTQVDQPVVQQSVTGDGTAVVTPQVPVAQSAMNQVDTPLLTPAESIAKAQVKPEVVDPAVAAANFNAGTNRGILTAIAPGSENQSLAPGNNDGLPFNQLANVPVTADAIKFTQAEDWRVRLSLAPSAYYLYQAENPGILEPLVATNGVIFPYTPSINTSYKANYENAEVTHSNYKMHFYKNSSVEDVTITAEFTAQDTVEANYLLAVIHFFKSATKMFYGKDTEPVAGTPPPLLYLSGYGKYQFDNHPLLLTSFQYNLPNDVDYIRAGTGQTWSATSIGLMKGSGAAGGAAPKNPITSFINKIFRLDGNGLPPNGVKPTPSNVNTPSLGANNVTYVPTKIQITLNLLPVVSRRDISQNFSLEKYATGELLQSTTRQSGGIW